MSDSTSARLSQAANGEQSPLDDEARARIRARVRIEGPGIVARARVVRQVSLVARVVVPVLAVAVAYSAWPRHERTCQGFGPEVAQFEKRDDGRQVLELARARFVASADADVAIGSLTSCESVVTLRSGRLYVHARDLGGGALTVSTPRGDAVVHGTVFSVESSSVELAVDVAEGVVEVRPQQASPARVLEGQRWSSGRVQALRPEASKEMLALKSSDRLVKSDPVAPTGEVAAAEPSAAVVELDPTPAVERDLGGDAKRRSTKARAHRRAEPASDPKSPGDPGAPPAPERNPVEADDEAPLPDRSAIAPRGEAASPSWPKPSPAPIESAEELVQRGDALVRAGELDDARVVFRQAGRLTGATAEAAWLALARLELQAGEGEAARQALRDRKSRFGRGQLDIEAAWILVRAHDVAGDAAAATLEARRIVQTWPTSAQANAAKKWLAQHSTP